MGLTINCPLAGAHQVDNAVTALGALTELGTTPGAIDRGIAATRWPGRLELVRRDPDVLLLDGAHNPAGARALAEYLLRFHAGRRVTLIFAAMRDKSVQEAVEILFPLAHDVVITALSSGRAPGSAGACRDCGSPRCTTAADRPGSSWHSDAGNRAAPTSFWSPAPSISLGNRRYWYNKSNSCLSACCVPCS